MRYVREGRIMYVYLVLVFWQVFICGMSKYRRRLLFESRSLLFVNLKSFIEGICSGSISVDIGIHYQSLQTIKLRNGQ